MTSAPISRPDRLAILLLQIGAVAIVLVAVPFKAFDLDRYFVPKELVLHLCAAATALLLVVRRTRLAFSVTDQFLAAFLAASLLSSLMATNLWLASRAVAISLSGAALFWVTSALRRDGLATSPPAARSATATLWRTSAPSARRSSCSRRSPRDADCTARSAGSVSPS
jgi:hypothetical protein